MLWELNSCSYQSACDEAGSLGVISLKAAEPIDDVK